MNTKRLVTLSLFLTMSIVLGIVESFIPVTVSYAPGAKLGLANIMTLVVLYLYGEKDAFLIVTLRVFLVGLLLGTIGAPGFFMSMSGGLLAYVSMVLIKNLKVFTIVSVSIIGALGHSLGQIVMAIIFYKTPELVYYLPALFIISIPAGIFTGYVAKRFLVIAKNAILIEKAKFN